MRFFTLQNWGGESPDISDLPEQYAAHINSIRTSLTPSLAHFIDNVHLHDANLVKYHHAQDSLALDFIAYIYDAAYNSHGRDDLRLKYSGVSSVEITSGPSVGLPGPHSFGDLGYDELDYLTPDNFEHRMLFSSGIEIIVTFKDLAFTRSARS